MSKIGEAECQTRIDSHACGDYIYNAGIVRLNSINKLIVQRVLRSASVGTPFEIVSPDEIPDEIREHPQIAVWSNVGYEAATLEEATGLIEGSTYSYHHPSLGYQPTIMSHA